MSLQSISNPNSIKYFQKLLNSKKKEFIYVLKEKLFGILFDQFIDNYDSANFALDADGRLKDLAFEQKNEYFKYFFKSLSDMVKDANYNTENTPRSRASLNRFLQDHDPKITKMIDFYFDENLFRLLKGEIESAPNFENNSELRLLDILQSAIDSNLIGEVAKEVVDVLSFKIQQTLSNASKFFLWFLRNAVSSMQNLKYKISVKDLIAFRDCSHLKIADIFSKFLCKVLLIVIHKFGILLKVVESEREFLLKRFSKEFFQQLKAQFEELFNQKVIEGNKLQGDSALVLNELKQAMNLGFSHMLTLIVRLDQPLRQVIEAFGTFIEIPMDAKIFISEFENFENGMFTHMIARIKETAEKILDSNASLDDSNKIEVIDDEEADTGGVHDQVNFTQASAIINRSFEQPSMYFSGFTNKKYVFEKIMNIDFLLNDLIIILESGLSKNRYVLDTTLNFYSYSILRMINYYRQKIASDMSYKKTIEQKLPDNWQMVGAKFDSYLLKFDKFKENQPSENQLDGSFEREAKEAKMKAFDFSAIDNEEFWKVQKRTEFYEKVLILFSQFFSIYVKYNQLIQHTWKSLDDTALERIQKVLGIKLALSDLFEDLEDIYKTTKARKADENLSSKILGKVSLSSEETITGLVIFFFEVKNITRDMFLYLKFNFDYMISFFFKQNIEAISTIDLRDRQFLNTTNQINEARNYLMSFDNLTKNYLTHEKIKNFFVINSIETFFDNLNLFIFKIKDIFADNKKYLNKYYEAVSKHLMNMDLMQGQKDKVALTARIYKNLKKILFAANIQELDELVQDFNLDPDSREVQLVKAGLEKKSNK